MPKHSFRFYPLILTTQPSPTTTNPTTCHPETIRRGWVKDLNLALSPNFFSLEHYSTLASHPSLCELCGHSAPSGLKSSLFCLFLPRQQPLPIHRIGCPLSTVRPDPIHHAQNHIHHPSTHESQPHKREKVEECGRRLAMRLRRVMNETRNHHRKKHRHQNEAQT